MKLNVPYFKQRTALDCGPTALRMVIAYLDNDLGFEEIEKATGYIEGKAQFSIQLAIGSKLLGFNTKFISKHIFNINMAELDNDFSKKNNPFENETLNKLNKLIDYSKELSVELIEKKLK